uniref:Uncharacterized protein n=1 Tax=Picea glauca TaxID=3330 RepID=A0A101LWF8_PICGL|nr:hypothetical protein ABT39_MTgene1701 [Picea glauca]
MHLPLHNLPLVIPPLAHHIQVLMLDLHTLVYLPPPVLLIIISPLRLV